MKVRHNNKIDKIINLEKELSSDLDLSKDLMEILDKGFVRVDGCKYFKQVAPEGLYSKELVDRTGNECFYNKIHIEDYTNNNESLKQGLQFAKKLYNILKKDYEDKYKVILVYDLEEYACTVFFHKIRVNEEYMDDDLESYPLDGIVVLEN